MCAHQYALIVFKVEQAAYRNIKKGMNEKNLKTFFFGNKHIIELEKIILCNALRKIEKNNKIDVSNCILNLGDSTCS